MARKSKRAGTGQYPLTHAERKSYATSSQQGTIARRLNGISQYAFGQCALSSATLSEAAVATCSGYLYDRSAMMEYLLHQTETLQKQQQAYETHQERLKETKKKEVQNAQDEQVKRFETAQQRLHMRDNSNTSTTANDGEGPPSRSAKTTLSSTAITASVTTLTTTTTTPYNNTSTSTDTSQKRRKANPLANASYWLADFQPQVQDQDDVVAPPKRPSSPMTKAPLRMKDLIPLHLNYNASSQVLCALSEKPIIHQQALALIPKQPKKKKDKETKQKVLPAQVVLEQVYNDVVKNNKDEKESTKTLCPITGHRLAKILKLQKGGSSFAANGGTIQAQTYRPTLT